MTILGKYELLEKLGEGATAEVYRARDTTLGREAALKVLKPALVADASAFERFAREAHAAAGLFHSNIATVLDMGEAGGRYFIAMRYFPGQSLDKILKDGPLSWSETLQLARQIGSALDFAHAQGFLHRDVKPANIIRAQDGNFILTDFGLTRAMLSTNLTSHTGAILGTPAYIAPEIWHGEPAVPASDQYALACVICEALTGQALFTGNTPPAVMTQHVLKGPQLPTAWPRDVPAGISDVLRRALSASVNERYPDMAAFSTDCTDLLAPPVVVTAPPMPETTPPPLKVNPQPEQPAKTPPTQNWRVDDNDTPRNNPALRQVPSKPVSAKSGNISIWIWIIVGLMVFCCFIVGAMSGFGWLLRGSAPPTIPSASTAPITSATRSSRTIQPVETGIPSISTASITSATMTADNTATGIATTTFTPNQTFYCVVVLANAPDTTKVKAVWFTVDTDGKATQIAEKEIVGSGSPIIFNASNNAGPWPVGKYRVEIYLDDKINNTLDFSVQ